MNKLKTTATLSGFRRMVSFVRRQFILSVSVLTAAFGIFTLTGAMNSGLPPVELQLTELQRSTFTRVIERPGVIEPLKSDAVRSDCLWNSTILSIVPEGTWVQKGDVVCVLDSSEIEEFAKTRELLLIKYRSRLDSAIHEQTMLKSDHERKLTAAQFLKESAVGELAKYRDGTFPQEEQALEQNLAILAEQTQAAASEIRHTERLWAMGMVSRGQMESDSLAVYKLQQKHDQMASQLNFLTDFSQPRNELQLEYSARQAQRNVARTELTSGLAMTKSRLTTLSYERTLGIYERYYRRAVDSIRACTLRAPCSGQVVYGNSWYLMSRGITQIEVGATVRNLQKVFEIPDPTRLKVSVPVNESSIYQIENGMPVIISPVGYEDVKVAGRVFQTSRYPRSRSSYTPHLKDYWLDVELLPTSEQRKLLKPKADVTVELTLENIADVIQVPRDSVTGIAGHNFVYVYEKTGLKARSVELAEANQDTVCVKSGLSVGDQLVTGMLPEHKSALHGELRKDLGLVD